MSEGITCYERDEDLCEDPTCLRSGCKMRKPTVLSEECSQHQQMRNAIDAVELALNNLEVDCLVAEWEGASDDVMIRVPLGAIRRLGSCYPELNRIINDPAFERPAVNQDDRCEK